MLCVNSWITRRRHCHLPNWDPNWLQHILPTNSTKYRKVMEIVKSLIISIKDHWFVVHIAYIFKYKNYTSKLLIESLQNRECRQKFTFCFKWKRSHSETEPSMLDENNLPHGNPFEPARHHASDETLELGFPWIVYT
jgi:hypothetical protein